MTKAFICLALLLALPFLTPDDTVGDKKPCDYLTVEKVASDLGLGECVLSENGDESSRPVICVNSCVLRLGRTEGILLPSCEVEWQADWQATEAKEVQQMVSMHIAYYDRDVLVGSTKTMSNTKFEKGPPSWATMKAEVSGDRPGNRLAVLIVEEPSPGQESRPIKVLSFQSMIVRAEK